jgi:sterol desaturase/sphingolipid hydroxylase (fatty acid hydroxylase superfamily)
MSPPVYVLLYVPLSTLSILLYLQHTFGIWDVELPSFGVLSGCNRYYQSYLEYMLSRGFSLTFCGAFMSASSAVFLIIGLNFSMQIIYKYDLFRAYKIQSDNEGPSEELTRMAVIEFILTHIFYFPVIYAILWALEPFLVAEDIPDVFMMTWKLIFCHFIDTTISYWNHRILHHRLFYKHFHKKHHKFNAPISWAAGFFTYTESFALYILPNLLGPILLRCHISVYCIHTMGKVANGVDDHCGYALPFSPYAFLDGARTHDFHHSHNTGNYSLGGFIFWDWLCGTDEAFQQFNRERVEKTIKSN